MFKWPKIIESRDSITITGRHFLNYQTANRREAMFTIWMIISGGVIVGLLCGVIGRLPIVESITIGAISSPFDGFVLIILMMPIYYGIWARPRTTVSIRPTEVVIDGMRYNRTNAAIRFTNLYPQSIVMKSSEGQSAMVGSLDETGGLRMFYGTNAVLITTFNSVEKAGRFALACNSALARSTSPATSRFANVTVTQLFRGQEAGEIGHTRRQFEPSMKPVALLIDQSGSRRGHAFGKMMRVCLVILLIAAAFFHRGLLDAVGSFRSKNTNIFNPHNPASQKMSAP